MQVDTLIVNARIFNSYVKTFQFQNAAVVDGRFLYIGPKGEDYFTAGEVIDAGGCWMIPGLIDIHLHIESSMVAPGTFSNALLHHGVTTIVPEPHEMANVFGLDGVKEMIHASRDCLVDMFYAIPSSVPATNMETTGGAITISDMETLLQTEPLACMGEIMNYTDIIQKPEGRTNQLLQYFREHYPDFIIEGHCPRLMDIDLQRVIHAGVDSDHTHQTVAGMEERIKSGMFIEIQEKSMSPEVMDYLIQHEVKEHFCFVTDDVMPDSLYYRGHLDAVLKKAVDMGMAPEDVIYAATYTPAQRMKFHDRGVIKPGTIADFVLLNNLETFEIENVFKNGKRANTENGRENLGRSFPASFYQSVQLAPLSADDFMLEAANTHQPGSRTTQRVIKVKDGSTFTREEQHSFSVQKHGRISWENSGFGLLSTFERYGKNGNRAHVLIDGDIIKRGAIATTYSHDNHNLLSIGHDAEDLVLACNKVMEEQGGLCLVESGEILSFVPLPVGGILTEDPLDTFAPKIKKLRQEMIRLGYRHYNPLMSLSTLSLAVSPAIKLTDHGLIDVNEGTIISNTVN
ncbi:adenine deaminase C-terminal domain-containing protein [Salibacterium aidingense]|uniref:adenine deaminase C-terminal domain-containing protein n=1 Tax=Salibacterium aidingense TaxID=384933 RepID=UPI003BEE0886